VEATGDYETLFYPAAEYAGQHQQGQPDEREKKIVSIFRDDPIKIL